MSATVASTCECGCGEPLCRTGRRFIHGHNNASMSIRERFRQCTQWRGDCLEWTGTRSPEGYGVTKFGGKSWRVHRLAWTLAKGPIPHGLVVCHRCDNPPCCNLEDLFLGTVADNNRDRDAKGRTPKGSSSYQALLTEDDVREILLSEESSLALGQRFGVSDSAIHAVRYGLNWAHFAPDLPRRRPGAQVVAERRAAARVLRDTGLTLAEIGIRLGVHHGTICRDLQAMDRVHDHNTQGPGELL